MSSERKIKFIAPYNIPNKVSAIKAIRALTDSGLKEAKDASERVGEEQYFSVNPQLTDAEIEAQIRVLRNEGFEVGPPVQQLIEELRKLGAHALMMGEDELANEILQLVLAEKLRRKT